MTIPMWCSTSSTVRSRSSRSEHDQLAELVDLLVAEAAGRLVEHQQPRPLAERARDLDPLERAVGQPAGGPVGDVGEAEPLEHLVGLLARTSRSSRRSRGQRQRRREEAGAAAVVRAEHHVVAHRQRVDQRRGSGTCARCRAPAISCARRAEQVLAGERDRPLLRRVEPADAVEQRRLAGAVGPDQAADAALLDLERRTVEGDDAPEPHHDPAHLEQAQPSRSSPCECTRPTPRARRILS